MTLPIYDLSTPAGQRGFQTRLARLRQTGSSSSQAAKVVAGIIADVRRRGDRAVVHYMRKWTDQKFTSKRMAVTEAELDAAARNVDPLMRKTIQKSIAHVTAYQRHILPRQPQPVVIDGCELGLRFTPVDSVGLLVPGGRAALVSSLVMLAAPALAAGVPAEAVSVVSPPPTRRAGEPAGDISPLVLAACRWLGIKRVYRIGGAQAVAALAFGSKHVRPVDLIAGPGNVFVQLAKAQLSGVVGTDNGFYGPSEIVTIADQHADPRRVAADLIAQAEHDPGRCFLISWSRQAVRRIVAEVEARKTGRQRIAAINASLRDDSAALLVRNEAQAREVADLIAAEHVNLAVRNPQTLLAGLRHGGEFFLGDQTPVAAGDYFAGPSHCLPTGATARFASGVSVYTFLKRSGTVWYRRGMSPATAAAIARLAEAEGLDGHADSAHVRIGP